MGDRYITKDGKHKLPQLLPRNYICIPLQYEQEAQRIENVLDHASLGLEFSSSIPNIIIRGMKTETFNHSETVATM